MQSSVDASTQTDSAQKDSVKNKSGQKNIAIIGSGISGLFCAYLLSRKHCVTVFEAETQIGGHTATKAVTVKGQDFNIDTGFIVFNDRTYPNFIKLLSQLGVASQPTDMGFSVCSQTSGFEYSGTSLNGLFAQRSNLFSWRYWRMLKEILHFNKACTQAYFSGDVTEDLTLGDYLRIEGYSQFFQDHYILPMVSAIWSSGIETAAAMPLKFFVQFFHNHGLLSVTQQPQWFTIPGGSKTYLTPLTRSFKDRIHTQCAVQWVKRHADNVTVATESFGQQQFDEVVFACHSDQALKLLLDPSENESDILSAIPYKPNDVCLHTDINLLPKSKRAWASWNYFIPNKTAKDDAAALTYNMNILQCLKNEEIKSIDTTFCVSVNANDLVNPELVLGQYRYSHPVFTLESIAAQKRWLEISGQQRTYFCGAYWRNGFHEDGVVSALNVVRQMGEDW